MSSVLSNTSKPVSPSAQSFAQAPSQTPAHSVAEYHGHKRVSGSGGVSVIGASSTPRSILSTPRNDQSLRKQHKALRRPKLADEDADAESAAVQSTSSRKGRTSITHLMNFALPPRPQAYPQNHQYQSRHSRRNPTWGLGSGYHAADKARYIHANYRFIVKPYGDYRVQAIDADFHLDWDTVLQILVSARSQASTCPICLSHPVAPRMAKCGHIFCLPCLIRYVHSVEDPAIAPERRAKWKKCPICYDSIYISETRSVRWFTGQEVERPHEGADVVLKLIVRRLGSTLALPRSGAERTGDDDSIPWYFVAEAMDYARIMKGSEDYICEQHENEIEELEEQEREDELMFGEDSQWTRRAIASIRETVQKLQGIGNPQSNSMNPTERKSRRARHKRGQDDDIMPEQVVLQQTKVNEHSASRASIITQYERSGSFVDVAAQSDMSIGKPSAQSQSSAPISTETSFSVRSQSAAPILESPQPSVTLQSRQISSDALNGHHGSAYYFYEALHHYYLSSLDIRILKASFGDYASFPATLLLRVERLSSGHIVDDELRRRTKYLGHLPQGCEVGFLECDWTDVVSPEILLDFAGELDRRRRRNREKDVREEKERLRAERDEDDKRWATARRKRPDPQTDANTEMANMRLVESTATGSAPVSTSPQWPFSREGQPQGSAFDLLASPSTSPIATKTVWGTRIVPPTTPPFDAAIHESELADHDGWLEGWEADLLQDEEELVAHIQATSLDSAQSKPGPAASNNRKKKGKKITLMSTTVRRAA